MNSKKAAVELSIGTIVIIVLAMSMLILGILLVRNIFGAGMDITDSIKNELDRTVANMFNDDKRLGMAPSARFKEVKVGETTGFGFAIANRLSTGAKDAKFRYEIEVSEENLNQYELNKNEVLSWIKSGKEATIGKISTSIPYEAVILVTIPEDEELCEVTYMVRVFYNGNQVYDTSSMALIIRN
jgi:hypothetical protein